MAIRRTNKSLVQRLGGDSIFGTGLDGSVTIANGTTTYLTRDMYYSSLTVDSGGTLFTNGFRVFVQGTLTNNGTIGFPAATAANVSDGSGTIAGRQSSLNPANAWGVSTSAVSSSALNDLDDALAGWFITANGTQTKIGSGSLGVTGNAGAIATNAGAGGAGGTGNAGPLGIFPGANAGQAGGIGNPGNPGSSGNAAIAGTGGAGGLGGGLVVIVAKTIAGTTGSILSRGFTGSSGNPATPGNAGAAGSAGTTAPTRPASHNAGGHPSGNHPHPAGSAPVYGHTTGTVAPASHNQGTYHHPSDSFLTIAPHSATPYSNAATGAHNPNVHTSFSNHNATSNATHQAAGGHHSAHNPNTHIYWSNHNATSNASHVPALTFFGHHNANGARNFSNHQANANPGKNHNAGHGSHHSAATHHGGNHNSGHGHHPHPASHNAGNHNSGHGHHAGNTGHNSGSHTQPAGTSPANAGPWTSPANPAYIYYSSNSTAHPSFHNAGYFTFPAANHNAGLTGSNALANPSATPHPNWPGGPGGAAGTAGTAGTANAGGTGVTGSDGGVIIIARNLGTANTQMSHSNFPYTKAIDI